MCGTGSPASVLDQLEDLRQALGRLDVGCLDDTQRLALLRANEDLTRSLAALSVRGQVTFAESQVASQAESGVPARRRGLAVADDIAAARRTSPSMGSRELSSAKALVKEMPRTFQALADATISAYQSRIITEATSCLSAEDRAEVDERLAGALPGASNAEIAKAARALVYEVDPAGFVRRARQAAKDRGVSVRPAPDVMAVLSGRLPAPHAIACYQALRSHAVAARASGDPRSLNQLMADELVARLTGRTVVDGIDVEVGLVMTDAALFDGASDAADLEGYGPIPAEMARDLLRRHVTGTGGERPGSTQDGPGSGTGRDAGSTAADPSETSQAADKGDCPEGARCTSWDCTKTHGLAPASGERPPSVGDDSTVGAAKAWLRRLYVDPATGVLTARDARRRAFTGSLRAFLIARDRSCRNSWCGAPIRDIDHIRRHRDGGATDAANGRGLCHRCNLARERHRHHEPPPDSYRPPPPAVTTILGRQLARAPATGPHDPLLRAEDETDAEAEPLSRSGPPSEPDRPDRDAA